MQDDEALEEFGVTVVPATDHVSGFVGLVLQPDAATIRASYALASARVADGAEMRLSRGQLPHVTLTQCLLRDAPREHLAGFLARLTTQLAGLVLPLRDVTLFPGGFVFWCVDPAAPQRRALQAAHEDALAVAAGFLDPVGNAAVVEGTKRLTGNDPQLVANAQTFGYAFVKDRYLPHITLGFDARLAVGGATFPSQPQAMTVARVVLAAFGAHGRVERVLV